MSDDPTLIEVDGYGRQAKEVQPAGWSPLGVDLISPDNTVTVGFEPRRTAGLFQAFVMSPAVVAPAVQELTDSLSPAGHFRQGGLCTRTGDYAVGMRVTFANVTGGAFDRVDCIWQSIGTNPNNPAGGFAQTFIQDAVLAGAFKSVEHVAWYNLTKGQSYVFQPNIQAVAGSWQYAFGPEIFLQTWMFR